MSGLSCARPGCDNEVTRLPGLRGRPPIYCSPACRPSLQASAPSARIVVELEQLDTTDNEHASSGRDWLVRIRRGRRSTVVANNLGRFSATVFADELRAVVEVHKRHRRTIE